MHYSKRTIAKLGMILVAIIVGVIAVFLILQEVLKATIAISTTKEATISIVSIPENETIWTSSGDDAYSIRVKKGSYTVQLEQDSSASKRTVALGFRGQADIDIQPETLKGFIRTSDQEISSPGLYQNQIVGLQARTPTMVNEKGDVLYSKYSKNGIQEIIFSDSDAFAVFTDNGSVELVTGESARPYNGEDLPVVDLAYDAINKQYCGLRRDGTVININLTGEFEQIVDTLGVKTFIRCLGKTVVVGDYRELGDGEGVPREGNVSVYTDGKLSRQLKTLHLSALELIDENTIAYVNNGVVYSYTIESKKTTPLQTIESLSEKALHSDTASGTLYVFDEETLWLLNINEASSVKIVDGFKFRAVNGALTNAQGELVLSIDARSQDSGIYKLSSNAQLVSEANALSKTLPKRTYFYSAKYFIKGDVIQLEVDILGGVPITETSVVSARAEAEAFVASLNLSPNVVVTYD